MAKTRKKIARIPFDDLEAGQAVQVMWENGDQIDTSQGLFVRFTKIDKEWFLVLRVLEKELVSAVKRDWVDRGEIQISTRARVEVWHWERK